MKTLPCILLITLIFFSFSCKKEDTINVYTDSDLEENFRIPPHSAKPKTWMHVMSGNMSREGLTKDLESMEQIGLGGLLLFNISQGIPNGPVKYNSTEHHELITHAAKEAERLGLSFGVHNCDGWSSSGGPWVTPEESMKMVVWSETHSKGGKQIKVALPQPTNRKNFYKDIAVIAYPSLPSEIDDFMNRPEITASDPNINIEIISDQRKDQETTITKTGDDDPWIQFSYPQPKTIRSVKINFTKRQGAAILQVSEDGKVFKDIRKLSRAKTTKREHTFHDEFEGITSKYFRLRILNTNKTTTLQEATLSATRCIDNLLGRTAIERIEDHLMDTLPTMDTDMIIAKERIKNLSSKMNPSGILTTDLPEGNWTILRFGYTTTGAMNFPASKEGKGLEVDKLKRSAFKKHYDAFVKKVINNSKPIAPNALQYVEIDSYEMGGQNWTEDFDRYFKEEYGYDIIEFFPIIAGRYVESVESSEAILWDYRKQICTMMEKNYFQYFTELCHEDGLVSYIEPYGFGPLNDLDVGKHADIPMGEFWTNNPASTATNSAISSAHIYGKPVISAEAFTSRYMLNWKAHPAMAKNVGDHAWTLGINEFMFHRFTHQANTNVEPGMTMNRWGFHFDRTQPWWYNGGKAWMEYITRGSYLLRQGNPVSDVLIFVGDGAPNSSYSRNQVPEIPKNVHYDCVNADVLLNRLSVDQGVLKLPEGTSYKILVLKNTSKLTLKTLKRIHEISEKGIPVYGRIPKKLAGYKYTQEQRKEFQILVKKLSTKINKTINWSTVYEENQIHPDVEIKGKKDCYFSHRKTKTEDIYFLYNPDTVAQTFRTTFRIDNKIPELWNPIDGSIKKLGQFDQKSNRTVADIPLQASESVFVIFREPSNTIVSIPENSNPKIEYYLDSQNKPVALIKENGDYTARLQNGKNWNIRVTDLNEPILVPENWTVTFAKKGSYEGILNFDSLIDWKDHPLDSVIHYSGTATYKKTITIPEDYLTNQKQIHLDLGIVKNIAELKINGKDVAVLWMPPFEQNITEYLKPGENSLEIKITNLWVNKLIGDARYPANDDGYKRGANETPMITMPSWYTRNEPRPKGKRTTFTTASFYEKDDPLISSGLIGPVKLKFYKTVTISQ